MFLSMFRASPATCSRFYCSSAKKVAQSPLAFLRRRTGFPLNKCRQALDKYSNDVDEAEQWLRAKAAEEGWQKTESLAGRQAKQGLISAAAIANRALSLETNCETDFVARTEDFKHLVSTVTTELIKMADTENDRLANTFESQFQSGIGKLGPIGDWESVEEAIAKTVGIVSENVLISQAHLLVAKESNTKGHIVSFVYDNTIKNDASLKNLVCEGGKYACLLHLLEEQGSSSSSSSDVTEVARRVCQHIIGMKCETVGRRAVSGSEAPPPAAVATSPPLYGQPFLFNSSRTVGAVLGDAGLAVTSFVSVGPSSCSADVDPEHCLHLAYGSGTHAPAHQ